LIFILIELAAIKNPLEEDEPLGSHPKSCDPGEYLSWNGYKQEFECLEGEPPTLTFDEGDSGIYQAGPRQLTFIAGGEEIIRCIALTEHPPHYMIKVYDPDEFCFYHDHEAEARVYVGLEEYGPICAEAAEELAGPLEIKDEQSD
jgi:hypothetical protein